MDQLENTQSSIEAILRMNSIPIAYHVLQDSKMYIKRISFNANSWSYIELTFIKNEDTTKYKRNYNKPLYLNNSDLIDQIIEDITYEHSK